MGLQWTSDLLLGVDLIDRQHRELFERFDKLLEACRQGQGRRQLFELLDFLEEYVAFHFAEEEDLMRRVGYPQMTAHLRQHQEFNRQLAGLQKILKAEGPSISLLVETNETVFLWLLNHIRKVDSEFGAFLKSGSQAHLEA